MRILLAEDDPKLGRLIQHKLEREMRCSVDWVKEGNSAEAYALQGAYDLIILDWMIPGKSGLDVLRSLRQAGRHVPVLMLTARDAVEDRVCGLDMGADDYLVKPFSFAELMARIRALLRRPPSWEDDRLQVGPFLVDKKAKEIFLHQRRLQLTPREYHLLSYFLHHPNQTLTREMLLNAVWGWEDEVTPNTVDQYVHRLRKKIDLPGSETMIESVRGFGYRLVIDR